jgi:hypothetical protein
VKLAYVCYLVGWHRDGVGDKIETALGQWRSAGHDATLYYLNPRSPTGERRALEGEPFLFRGPVERYRATGRLYAAVRESRPDVIYLRYDLFVPPPSILARTGPAVVELNSNAQAELTSRSRVAALYERVQGHLLLRRAAGAVCVTHELARAVRLRAPELPIAVIANGIDLAGTPALPAPTTSGLRAAFLGDDVYWQGVDKIFELAAALPDWQFDLVGVPVERSRANVTCHGYLDPEQYEPILALADLAIGTLALHRKLMDEACAIKIRRYLAYGLPVILGNEDTDFAGMDPWYLLRLPNTESNVRENVERIRAFGTAIKGRRVGREVAERLSVEVKEAARLAFLSELAR